MNMGHDGNGVFGLEGKVTPETLSTAHDWCDFCRLGGVRGRFWRTFFLVRSKTGSWKKKNNNNSVFAYESSWLADLAVTATASLGGKGTLSGSKKPLAPL